MAAETTRTFILPPKKAEKRMDGRATTCPRNQTYYGPRSDRS
jgi:hypothetical protein